MSRNSTRKPRRAKARPGRPPKDPSKPKAFVPERPYPDFPLTPASNGAWQKKILGKVRYFGRWGKIVHGEMTMLPGDSWWQPALTVYQAQRDDLYAGREPKPKDEGAYLVKHLCSDFIYSRIDKQRQGRRMSDAMIAEYRRTTDRIVAVFGAERAADDVGPDDFAKLLNVMAEKIGPVRLSNEVTRTKTVFRWGYAAGKLAVDPARRYGPDFAKPDAAEIRKVRQKNGKRVFEAEQLRKLIEAAPQPLKAMLLLGVNCAFYAKDCAELPLDALDLDRGFLDFPRPKTHIDRRCALWTETVAALREVIANRPDGAGDLVFVGPKGQPLVSGKISVAASDLMKSLGMHKPGLGFATLRHVFRTKADSSMDFPAVRLTMGHADASIDSHYIEEKTEDDRLRAVADHVHRWLYSKDEKGGDR